MVSKDRNGVTCTFAGCGRPMQKQNFKAHFVSKHLREGEEYTKTHRRRYEVVRESSSSSSSSNLLPVAAPAAAAPVAAPVAVPIFEQRTSADPQGLPKKRQYILFKAADVANAFCFLLGDVAEFAPVSEIVSLTIDKKWVKYLTLLGLVRALMLLNARPGFIYLDQLELLPGANTRALALKEGEELFTYGKTRQPEKHRVRISNYKVTEVFSVPVDGYSYSIPKTELMYFLGDNGFHALRSDVSGEMCVLTKKDVEVVCEKMTRLKLEHPPRVYFDAETVMEGIRTVFHM